MNEEIVCKVRDIALAIFIKDKVNVIWHKAIGEWEHDDILKALENIKNYIKEN
jgi:hypothetical protein